MEQVRIAPQMRSWSISGVWLVLGTPAMLSGEQRYHIQTQFHCTVDDFIASKSIECIHLYINADSAIPAQREIESLPVFPRDCLKLQRLLGSGAFGEVYEGITTGSRITDVGSEMRVAVKVDYG